MTSSYRFVLIISGVRQDDIRAALAAAAKAPSATSQTPAADPIAPLIDSAQYARIPRTFVSTDTHPRTTNLLCWNCCLAFTGTPRFIALDSVRRDGACEWSIDGNFCSWACAATYIGEHFTGDKKWSLGQNLAVVRAQADGGKICPVACAPSRFTMSAYSGSGGLSQRDYVAQIEALLRA